MFEAAINSGDAEIQSDFMGFEDAYWTVAEYIPKDYTIVDLGCYMAPQCYIFKDYAKYIGVDCFDNDIRQSWESYIPPKRFELPNVEHFVMSIEEFLNSENFKALDLDKTYFIASYVPSDEPAEAFKKVKNMLLVYCQDIQTKGICAEEIGKSLFWRKAEIVC